MANSLPPLATFANPDLAALLRSAASSRATRLRLSLSAFLAALSCSRSARRRAAVHRITRRVRHFICSFMLLSCTAYAIAIVITAIMIAIVITAITIVIAAA